MPTEPVPDVPGVPASGRVLAQAPEYEPEWQLDTVAVVRTSRREPVAHLPIPRNYRVRVGTRVEGLGQPVVVGRRPSGPRIGGVEHPVLVAVPSPKGEVSASHVEVRQQGRVVVVTDLRSTNGTTVTVPGRVAVTLRQGESVVVLPGTMVDIGDGNVLEILPIQRITLQEDTLP